MDMRSGEVHIRPRRFFFYAVLPCVLPQRFLVSARIFDQRDSLTELRVVGQ